MFLAPVEGVPEQCDAIVEPKLRFIVLRAQHPPPAPAPLAGARLIRASQMSPTVLQSMLIAPPGASLGLGVGGKAARQQPSDHQRSTAKNQGCSVGFRATCSQCNQCLSPPVGKQHG